MSAPLFQHRHYVAIAATIASLPDVCNRSVVAIAFADTLARFLSAAMGNPCNGRDKVQS